MSEQVPPARTVTLVAAVTRNNVIGSQGGMPWNLPEDLKHFKNLTMGHAMVMGRRTFDSIGRALPGRRTLVVTRQTDWAAPGVEVFHSAEDAVKAAGPEVMVVGGGELYRQLMPIADVLEITHIDADIDGDTFFPKIDREQWSSVNQVQRDGFSFVTYRRSNPSKEASGSTDLAQMLATLEPILDPETYVYCTVSWAPSDHRIATIAPMATIREDEGLTLVVTKTQAEKFGLDHQFPAARISLKVHSALDAVGLTAAFSEALKQESISCNVLAGYYHDHILVAWEHRARAMAALLRLRDRNS